jgi:hypothetical protein
MKGEEVTRLKVGDRVRVTAASRVSGYDPGDKGMLWRRSLSASGNEIYYLVQMDKNPAGNAVTFIAGEIEPDA